jgi:hypothetical protein
MDSGVLVLLGVSALTAVGALWTLSHRRSVIERRLEALGFEPCEGDAPALERAWRALTGYEASQELHVDHCRGRIAGWGMMHHFMVREPADHQPSDNTRHSVASYPAYLFDLRDAGAVSRGAVTLHVQPPVSKSTRNGSAGAIRVGDSRPSLEVGTHPWSAFIISAHGKTAGKLDDVVPLEVQEKLVRAAAHGFDVIHLGNGKAAFATLSNDPDVESQIAYLSEWL